ncbi:MAG: hypothetical protein GX842_01510, partial [Spirochaetales bacterium]|nr:hypothetical protein [Spirochaetales bacterium]
MAKVTLRELMERRYPNYSKGEVEALVACRQLKVDGETYTTLDSHHQPSAHIE